MDLTTRILSGILDFIQGRILVEIVGEVAKNLGELQQFSSQPP